MTTVEVPDWVLISAFRYALGRQTYITADTASLLIEQKDNIRPDWQNLIVREINTAIVGGFAGAPIDVAQWERVLVAFDGDPENVNEETLAKWYLEAQGGNTMPRQVNEKHPDVKTYHLPK